MRITDHAIEVWRKRSGSKGSETQVTEVLTRMATTGTEVFLKERWRTAALLCHHYAEAKYMYYRGYILVVVDEALVTVHKGDKKRWIL